MDSEKLQYMLLGALPFILYLLAGSWTPGAKAAKPGRAPAEKLPGAIDDDFEDAAAQEAKKAASAVAKHGKEGKIVLYQFKRGDNVPSGSPFCCKAETLLRMAGGSNSLVLRRNRARVQTHDSRHDTFQPNT